MARDREPNRGVYLIPPFFPGMPPTVAFGGCPSTYEAAGLIRMARPTLFVRYEGVGNNAAKAAFKQARIARIGATHTRARARGNRAPVLTFFSAAVASRLCPPLSPFDARIRGPRPLRGPPPRTLQAGFKRTDTELFNALWCSPLKSEEYRAIRRFQRVNHFPGTWELGRKDRLARSLARMRRRHGAAFHIAPKTFNLPGDADEWVLEAQSTRGQEALYILKPPASSRGRGIRLARSAAEVPTHKNLLVRGAAAPPALHLTCVPPAPHCATLRRSCAKCAALCRPNFKSSRPSLYQPTQVQQYIKSPHTIDGLKYDLRVYACVTSFDPLRVYVYKEGLVRFATEKYSADIRDAGRKKMHITNYSVNSKGEGFIHNTSAEDDGVGSKWSLAALRRRFRQDGLDWERCWADIRDVVVKAFISVETAVNSQVKGNVLHNNRCFEIYGVDVLLDSDLKPWLIEVNTGPCLASPAPLDRHIKFRMVANMLNLVGVEAYDAKKSDADEAERRMARLTGLGGGPTSAGGAGGAAGGADGADGAEQPQSPKRPLGAPAGGPLAQEAVVSFARLGIDDLPDVVKARARESRRLNQPASSSPIFGFRRVETADEQGGPFGHTAAQPSHLTAAPPLTDSPTRLPFP